MGNDFAELAKEAWHRGVLAHGRRRIGPLG